MNFIAKKWPYLLGFCIIEAGIYYFNGATGNFNTGFIGLFAIWCYYAWMYRDDYRDDAPTRGGASNP